MSLHFANTQLTTRRKHNNPTVGSVHITTSSERSHSRTVNTHCTALYGACSTKFSSVSVLRLIMTDFSSERKEEFYSSFLRCLFVYSHVFSICTLSVLSANIMLGLVLKVTFLILDSFFFKHADFFFLTLLHN